MGRFTGAFDDAPSRGKFAGAFDDAVDFMTGYTRSIIGQGMGVGFGDEIEAGVRSVIPGQGGYDENLARIRAEQEQFQQAHPVIATGAEIVGGVLPAIATRGRSVPTSIANATGRGLAEGAAYGSAYGFGTGEGAENRLNQAGWGGVIGGAVGAAGAPVASALQWAGKTAARPVIDAVQGFLQPEAKAAKEVAKAIDADRALGQGLTPQQEALATQVTGQPITNLDRGGARTLQLARGAASNSPDASAKLNKTIGDRFEGQGERINAWLRTKTGVSGDASATREKLLDDARKANRPAYVTAYRAGNRPLASPELERLMEAPEVQTAAKTALQRGKSRAVAEKMPWNADARNLQFWDYVKREMDGMAGVAARAGDKGQAQVLSTLAKDLRDELDRLVPEFKPARSGAAGFFGAENALEAGQNFINLNVDVAQARRAILKMSPAERDLFGEGFVSALMDKVSRVRDRSSVISQVWGTPKARQQIETALGSAKAKEFEAFMAIEEVMDATRGAVQRYPGAARQMAEMALVGGGTWYGSGDPITGIVAALTYGGIRKGGKAITDKAREQTATRIAELLTSNDPTKYRNALRAVANNQAMMASLRRYIASLAGVTGGQQGSQLGAEAD